MGNSASSLPYSINDKEFETSDGCWDVHKGSQKSESGAPVTVFQAQKPSLAKEGFRGGPSNLNKLFVAHHHFVHSKKLRHPYILQVLATLDTDNPTGATTPATPTSPEDPASPAAAAASSDYSRASLPTTGAYIIVTEPCIPLSSWIKSGGGGNVNGNGPTSDQLAWGLQCIVHAISFLHTSAMLAHGNLSLDSFWVTPSGDVKLWNFGLVTPIGVMDGGGGPTRHFRDYENILTLQAYRSPERVQQQWQALATSAIHCMDSYGLGILINEYYDGQIPGPLQKATQRLQTPSLKMRPRLAPLLKCPVFDTQYSKLMMELEELQIQPVEQKLRFWQSLRLDRMDHRVAQFKILPLIQSTIATICGSDAMMSQDLYRREVLAMLSPLFYICEHILQGEAVGKELTPLVKSLFLVKDRGVRGALLGKTPLLANHLSQNDLNTSVFEPLCSGFADSSDALRELTLKATSVLVPHLFPPNVEKLSRYLVRLQSDTSPSIRTHTMGMIPPLAPHLQEVPRQKLLLPAFIRAFKDPHPPCRLASLQACVQSQEYFTLQELATKVLPAVMPLVLDGVSDVRKNSFQVIEFFLARLREDHQQRSLGEVNVSHVKGVNEKEEPIVPPATAPTSAGSYFGSMSSWIGSTTTSATTTTTSIATSNASNEETEEVTPAVPAVKPSKPPKPAPAFSSLSIGGGTTTVGAGDGWDDDDDDLDLLGTSANNDDTGGVEDVFASIGIKTTSSTSKPIIPAQQRSYPKSSGKLIMNKPTSRKMNTASKKPEVKKLTSLDDDLAGGWDDF